MARVIVAHALSGGDPRSLGRAEEIVRLVLRHPRRLHDLFECLFVEDETVRMRASDALEKICRQRPELVGPFTERLLTDVARIRQPSVQWHLAQILATLPLDDKHRRRAVALLKRNLERYDDWIVVNLTLEALATFARQSPSVRRWLRKRLPPCTRSRHQSVRKRATRLLAELGPPGGVSRRPASRSRSDAVPGRVWPISP